MSVSKNNLLEINISVSELIVFFHCSFLPLLHASIPEVHCKASISFDIIIIN